MRFPSSAATRLRLSGRTAAPVLIQLAALFALSGCMWPVPRLAQVPTVTLAFRTADPATEGGLQVLYRACGGTRSANEAPTGIGSHNPASLMSRG
jgi:hypothetical protein